MRLDLNKITPFSEDNEVFLNECVLFHEEQGVIEFNDPKSFWEELDKMRAKFKGSHFAGDYEENDEPKEIEEDYVGYNINVFLFLMDNMEYIPMELLKSRILIFYGTFFYHGGQAFCRRLRTNNNGYLVTNEWEILDSMMYFLGEGPTNLESRAVDNLESDAMAD